MLPRAGRRWLESKVHRGERAISRKAIAQGMPVVLAALLCLACAKCIFFARKAHGCGLHPAFPAPSFIGRRDDWQSSDMSCRENADSHPFRCRAPA
jgi:hypothetical protein